MMNNDLDIEGALPASAITTGATGAAPLAAATRDELLDPFGFPSAHLLGVGGCGMSSIARALMAAGVEVSGTDVAESAATRQLRDLGARIFIGHDARNLAGPGGGRPAAVIVSTAIRAGNCELAEARRLGLRVIHRGEALAMFLRSRKSILVTGAHGKTTTTAIAGLLLGAAGLDPWVFVGGSVPAFNGNTRVGGLEWAVAEADESDGTFERLPADHLICTNIDDDHLDYWKTSEALRAAYERVLSGVARDGIIMACLDDPGVCEVRRLVDRRILTYGLCAGAGNYSAGSVLPGAYESSFDLYRGRTFVRRYSIGAPGMQNVTNAVGALGLALELGAEPGDLGDALASFHGVARRFDVRGRAAGVTVIDDYAHHPTEIGATVDAARLAAQQGNGRVVAIFQPHRYTRTRDLMDAFGIAFVECDLLVLTDVYAAGEDPLPGVTIDALAGRIRRTGRQEVQVVHRRADVAAAIAPQLRPGDVALCLGAGDNWKTAPELLERLLAIHPENPRQDC